MISENRQPHADHIVEIVQDRVWHDRNRCSVLHDELNQNNHKNRQSLNQVILQTTYIVALLNA